MCINLCSYVVILILHLCYNARVYYSYVWPSEVYNNTLKLTSVHFDGHIC